MFLVKESKLHVLWNNAGVVVPPVGSKTLQGCEMQLGCNSLAHFLLGKLILPILSRTAYDAPVDSVRICWAETGAPDGVIDFSDINHEKSGSQRIKYSRSKAANILLASDFA
jgi:NAD(P)-dependent dehydrogenase (short-subunit alcohol dehydrogenase family)